jgi:predicted RNA methylase
MNFDDALKHYLPRVWFRFKFLKYKYLKRGEPELWLIRHLVEPGTTALDVGASIGIYAAEMARYAGKVIAFEANPEVAAFTRRVAARNVEVINVALSSRAGRTT